MTDTKEKPKAKKETKPKATMYEIYHGNIYLPDPDATEPGQLKHYCITHDKDNVPSEPIQIDATGFPENLIKALDDRKGIRKL